MPLHDWRDDRGWDSLHTFWQTQLIDWLQPRLPAGYRAFLGSVPNLTIGSTNGRPDLSVRDWRPPPVEPAAPAAGSDDQPDFEGVATLTLDADQAVHIHRHGALVAAVEIVSPRNKDRPDSRELYAGRYFGYIRQGVHLLLIDVLPRPAGFSFAEVVAKEAGVRLPPTPVPFAVSFRVGEPVPDGTLFAFWRRPLAVGGPLPTIQLALTVHEKVAIDLDHTYREAARRLYLD
jgi:hypothetical protein